MSDQFADTAAQHRRRMADHRQSSSDAIQRIRADTHLSPEGRQIKIDEATRAHRQRTEELRAAHDAAVQKERQRLRHAAFAVGSKVGSDPEIAKMSHRQALAAANAVKDKAELARMLRQADLAGDSIGKRAVLLSAFDRGMADVLVGSGDEAAGKLVDFERTYGDLRSATAKVSDMMHGSGPTVPREASNSAVA